MEMDEIVMHLEMKFTATFLSLHLEMDDVIAH